MFSYFVGLVLHGLLGSFGAFGWGLFGAFGHILFGAFWGLWAHFVWGVSGPFCFSLFCAHNSVTREATSCSVFLSKSLLFLTAEDLIRADVFFGVPIVQWAQRNQPL